jgi:hypothetical protein
MKKSLKPFTKEVAYATIPRLVRIGCYDFKLEAFTKREADAGERYGECDFDELMIRYSPDNPAQVLGNSILHEVLHAMHWAMGLPTGDEKASEEEFTTRGANGWQMVWRDNPALIAWLNNCFSEAAHA